MAEEPCLEFDICRQANCRTHPPNPSQAGWNSCFMNYIPSTGWVPWEPRGSSSGNWKAFPIFANRFQQLLANHAYYLNSRALLWKGDCFIL